MNEARRLLEEACNHLDDLPDNGRPNSLLNDIDRFLSTPEEAPAVQGLAEGWGCRECNPIADENEVLMKLASRACTLGMAAIATYGRRDEKGLAGTSKKHWDELKEISEQVQKEPPAAQPEAKAAPMALRYSPYPTKVYIDGIRYLTAEMRLDPTGDWVLYDAAMQKE